MFWLKPDRMRAYSISADEVLKAIDEQSVLARPGRVGLSSGRTAQSLEYVLTYKGWFNKPEEYEKNNCSCKFRWRNAAS